MIVYPNPNFFPYFGNPDIQVDRLVDDDGSTGTGAPGGVDAQNRLLTSINLPYTTMWQNFAEIFRDVTQTPEANARNLDAAAESLSMTSGSFLSVSISTQALIGESPTTISSRMQSLLSRIGVLETAFGGNPSAITEAHVLYLGSYEDSPTPIWVFSVDTSIYTQGRVVSVFAVANRGPIENVDNPMTVITLSGVTTASITLNPSEEHITVLSEDLSGPVQFTTGADRLEISLANLGGLEHIFLGLVIEYQRV